MSNRAKFLNFCFVVIILLMNTIIISCDRVPNQEIAIARTVINIARMSEAEKYAPKILEDAVNILSDAELKIRMKEYEDAKLLALEARQKAEEARRKAEVASSIAKKKEDEIKLQQINVILEEVKPKLDINYEKPMQITWYHLKLYVYGQLGGSGSQYSSFIRFYPYIGQRDSGSKWLRFRAELKNNDYISLRSLQFLIDGEVSKVYLQAADTDVDFSGGEVEEKVDISGINIENIMRKIANANEVYITFQGRKDRVSYEFTKEDLLIFKQFVTFYDYGFKDNKNGGKLNSNL